jgi:hypothetical protein
MERSAIPLVVGILLGAFLLAAIYIGGYFALSIPNSGPYERMFYTRWQCELYLPLIRAEERIRGELVAGYKS